jgi:hypothetical protein
MRCPLGGKPEGRGAAEMTRGPQSQARCRGRAALQCLLALDDDYWLAWPAGYLGGGGGGRRRDQGVGGVGRWVGGWERKGRLSSAA